MAGANPSLTAITDDASRGGLFTQSNIANPVSGADAAGATVNNTMVTLTVDIDGNPQTGTFFVNHNEDQTVTLTFTGIGGTTMGGGNPVERGVVAGQNIVLTRNDGSEVIIDASEFVTQGELTAALANVSGVQTFLALTDTPGAYGAAGEQLVVNADGDGLEFVPRDVASVAAGSFSSNDTTVVITQNGVQVDLSAQPEWTGNTNMGDNVGAAGVHAQNIILAADTGLILDNNNGQVTIRLADTAPTPAGEPTATTPPPSTALDPSPIQTIRVTPTGGTFDTTGGATPVRPTVTPPAGATPVTPMTTVDTNGGGATITIPGGGTNAPGNYMVQIDTDTTSPDGMVTMDTISETIERFVPFFLSRNEITPTAMGTPSEAAWSGSVTSIPGAGSTLYVAALRTQLPDATAFADISGFPVRVARVGTAPIGVTLADASVVQFNVFRLQANPGATVSNFRTTR